MKFQFNQFRLSDEKIMEYQNSLINVDTLFQVKKFHSSLPGYNISPCHSLQQLSGQCHLKNILVKDESKRFDLKAFKVLGASFAMAKILSNEFIHHTFFDYPLILEQMDKFHEKTFVTATDGNHGRAVAWSAKMMGCKAVIYLPENAAPERVAAIKNYGANVQVLAADYDECVQHARNMAQQNNWILLQDTAFDNYRQIPDFIMQGYFSLMEEFILQQSDWPSHILVQAGVGSFAAAIFIWVQYYCKMNSDKAMPKLIVVEPAKAPCFFVSNVKGQGAPLSVKSEEHTIMAGLDCGTPSLTAWDIIKDLADGFLLCDDETSIDGMRLATNPIGKDVEFVSGESGAVCLGAVKQIMTQTDLSAIQNQLQLNNESSVLVFSTEGITAPDAYHSLLNRK